MCREAGSFPSALLVVLHPGVPQVFPHHAVRLHHEGAVSRVDTVFYNTTELLRLVAELEDRFVAGGASMNVSSAAGLCRFSGRGYPSTKEWSPRAAAGDFWITFSNINDFSCRTLPLLLLFSLLVQ